jgi:hypothetical protein
MFRSFSDAEAEVAKDKQRTISPAQYKREKEMRNRLIDATKKRAAQVVSMGASIPPRPIMRINRPPQKMMIAAPVPTSIEKMVM